MKLFRYFIRLPRSNVYRVACDTTSRNCSKWKPFSLEDELNLDVKKSIESKWGNRVYGVNSIAMLEQQRKDELEPSNKKSYVLSMFPYPSGKLHLGHVRIYTLSDVLARYHRLNGQKVVHPIGWDAFGLPAENAARDNGIEPEKWTRENIQYMKEQILRMGCNFDWEREFATCDPTYYKWTQWLFSKLWELGLAYKKKAYVFWDPIDKTVLAEEQVDSDMRSWRSGAKVEKRLLNQWFIRTAVFAKELSECLTTNALRQGWRDIVDVQKHWIGPIKGYFTDCPILISGVDSKSCRDEEFLRLWFSSPDILQNGNFVILQPGHYLNQSEENNLHIFDNGVKQLKVFIRNPITGLPIPVFSGSNDILLPLVPESSDCRMDEVLSEEEYGELAGQESYLSKILSVLPTAKKYQGVVDEIKEFKYFHSSLKLRDWLVSRQRHWGTPIPAIVCVDCGHSSMIPVTSLPIKHTKAPEYPVCYNKKDSVLFLCTCPKCGSSNTNPETDTLDTFFDSSWYFLRYLDPQNEKEIFNPEKVSPWLPVQTYIGGKEHATLHLYYARFMSHFLHSLGMIPEKEPFKTLVPVGVVMGETFVSKTGKYLRRDEIVENELGKLIEKDTGTPVTVKWEKMSKSKHNGIDPDSVLQDYGLDSMRLLSMADIAPQSNRKWPSQSSEAFLKFQNKVWHTVQDFVAVKETENIVRYVDEDSWQKIEEDIFDVRNYHLKGVTHNMEVTSQISVAITKLQGITTGLRKITKEHQKDSLQFERTLGTLLIGLYPIMPAFSAQLWQYFRDVANLTRSEFDLDKEIWCQQWPKVDQNYKLDLIVHVFSEEVDIVKIDRQILDSIDETIALEFAFESEKVAKLISRESTKIVSFTLQPGFRAILHLVDLNNNFSKMKKSKKKSKVKVEKKSDSISQNQ